MLGLVKSWFIALSTSAKIGVITASIIGLGSVASATTNPTPTPQKPTTTQATQKQPETSHKDLIVKTTLPFKSTQVDDPTLTYGTKKTSVVGVNGEKLTVYDVTYSDGLEVSRKVKSETTTSNPVEEVILNGTFIASGSGSGYTNVDGNYISSPSSDPSGATAQCADGTYSYSQHRSGTCSHHGGVSRWL